MLKFLSNVTVKFNPVDPRKSACVEFVKQCNWPKAKDRNPDFHIKLKHLAFTDLSTPQITVTYLTGGHEEVFDATTTSTQTIRRIIIEKGEALQTQQMFREAGQPWPVFLPENELEIPFTAVIQPKKAEHKEM